ncbi:MAG: hypothetical protein RL211_1395 [Pseudomonadota bacterium]
MRWGLLVAGLLTLCSSQIFARGVDVTVDEVALVPWASILKDERASMTAQEVMSTINLVNPTKFDSEVFSTNFTSATYWFFVPLHNKQATPLRRVLVVDPAWLDEVQLTLTDAQGVVQTFVGGKAHPFTRRNELHRLVNVALDLPPGESRLLVRVQTRGPYFVAMSLLEPTAFKDFSASEFLYFGLLYGGLLSLFLFNWVLYLSSREKTYRAYCGLLLAFLAMHATYNGHAFRWVFPDAPELAVWPNSVTIYLYCFAGLIFSLRFLDLKNKQPVAYIWTWRLLYVMGITFVFTAVWGGYRAHVIASILWVVIYAVSALTLGLLSMRKRNTAAIYYLSGSVAGLIGSSCTALTVMGILPYSFATFRAVDFGMLLDAIMLSLALSERLVHGQRLERLRRFFSPAVADQLLYASSEDLYRPHHREIVVLFLDLRGYTAFTQKHGADEVMRILGEFHAAMGELIINHEATLERFAGDGMMIFLNDPVEISDPAVKGIRMALEMHSRFQTLELAWRQRGYSLSMGIGIAQGVATIGAIGFEGRRDYAAIGNVTNLAARLCAEAKAGQILVSQVVADAVRQAVQIQSVGALDLKGFSGPVNSFEVVTAARDHVQKSV